MIRPTTVLAMVGTVLLGCGDDGDTQTGGAGAGGGASEGGGSTGGGPEGAGGAGIDGPEGQWAWRPQEGTLCANGTPAGVGVNLIEGSTDLVIVVSGGGACWDDTMCNGESPASVHLHEELTAAIVTPEFPAVDRSDPNNPVSSASWVYVPYCTGDLHWGDARADYASGAIEHRGGSNMRTFLERLLATRPGTQRIFLFGGSAGGYGVTRAWGTAKEVFGDAVEVHSLADASPLVPPLGDRYGAMKAQWNIQWPEGCEGCEDDLAALVDSLAERYPDSRHGLLTYDEDAVIGMYFGYTTELPAAVATLLSDHYDAHENTKYFVGPGTDHGVTGDDVTAPDGTTPITFLIGWLLGAADWHSVSF